LDELYFLQPYSYLQDTFDFSPGRLSAILQELVRKGWVRVYRNATDEIDTRELSLSGSAEDYLYLASKEGLLAHNGR
jgi:DNA-binding MarR family transcriptional regulator